MELEKLEFGKVRGIFVALEAIISDASAVNGELSKHFMEARMVEELLDTMHDMVHSAVDAITYEDDPKEYAPGSLLLSEE